MNATIVVLGLVVALAAAARSTWSPCGQSMLSQLTPVGEASRGYRYRTTASWFIAGAVVGGAMLGGVMAALAAAVSSLGVTSTTLLGIAAALAVLGGAVDSGVLGDLDQQAGEAAPAVVRLDAGEEHQLAPGRGLVVRVDRVVGPDDAPGDTVLQHDLGPHLLGIEVRIAVDGRQPGRGREFDEVVERAGGGRGGVEVARERDHQDRRARRPLPFPDEVAHTAAV
jgi:hypothetical protein